MLDGNGSSNHEPIMPIAASCATSLAVLDYGFDRAPTVGLDKNARLVISQAYRHLLTGNFGIHITEG